MSRRRTPASLAQMLGVSLPNSTVLAACEENLKGQVEDWQLRKWAQRWMNDYPDSTYNEILGHMDQPDIDTNLRTPTRTAPCRVCGEITEWGSIGIEEKTLRRTRHYLCPNSQSCPGREEYSARQVELRRQRAVGEMPRITDYGGDDYLTPEFPEQYGAMSRKIIRSFHESPFTESVVEYDQFSLNNSIATLGLGDTLYTEQRDGKVVLRKVLQNA